MRVVRYHHEVPTEELSSPKRSAPAEWYSYYAGFSATFARDFLSTHRKDEKALVLDPWVGSGTTLLAARSLGLRGIGYDLNPAMAVLALARNRRASATRCFDTVQKQLASLPDSGSALSHIIARAFPTPPELTELDKEIQKMSREAVSIVAACLVAAKQLYRRTGSNPTWPKHPSATNLPVAPEVESLYLGQSLTNILEDSNAPGPDSRVYLADSRRLYQKAESVDIVLTSPPYCTRIDYAIHTSIELGLLGFDKQATRALRESQIGTPVVSGRETSTITTEYVINLIRTIEEHNSYAAASYYAKFFRQYFAGLETSLQEVARVLKPGGTAGVVVQPSHFKELIVDLPIAVQEILEGMGLNLTDCKSWNARDLRSVNTQSRTYVGTRSLQETLLIFMKPYGTKKR